jgi:hypothetical protein
MEENMERLVKCLLRDLPKGKECLGISARLKSE